MKINACKYIVISVLLMLVISCKESDNSVKEIKSHPSHNYRFVDIDSLQMDYLQTEYVPVYSDIYHRSGTLRFNLTVTLSVRNTSMNDSVFIFSTTYYDSVGKKLKEYVDSSILLAPLESIEFVVDEKEMEGGAGANFIVSWGTKNYSDQLLIQAVMIGTYGQQGISFITNSKVIYYKKAENNEV
jgi:Protein of unknown function (DUF3124)